MNKRGGPSVKIIIIAASLLSCIYLLYIYNESQSRLREAEASADRYRRSDESKVAQLQDSIKEKEVLQEKCENDRQEFVNRLNSLNSQHKMLKSNHNELEAENGRIQQEMQKLKDDNANIEAQRSQEFSQMKQEKELEIASLRDQLANMQRQNDELQNEISSLKSQLQNAQQSAAAAANVVNQLQQQQQQQPQQQLLQQQQNQVQLNPMVGVQANDLLNQGQVLNNGVQNMNQNLNQNVNNFGQVQNEQHQMPAVNLNQQAAPQQGQGNLHQGQMEVNNAQHQMQAPNMDGIQQAGGNQNQQQLQNDENNAGEVVELDGQRGGVLAVGNNQAVPPV